MKQVRTIIKRFYSKAIPLALMVMVFGCHIESCESLLTTHFNQDTVGSSPDYSLPGTPDGDLLYYSRESGPEVSIIAGNMLSFKSIRGFTPQYLAFFPKQVVIDRPIYYFWQATPAIAEIPLTVYFGDGHFSSFGGIKFDTDGRIKIKASADENDYVDLGPYENARQHMIWIRYDPTTRNYRVKITPDGGQIIDSGDKPMTGSIPNEASYPAIYFMYPSDQDQYRHVVRHSEYKVRLMTISKKKPE